MEPDKKTNGALIGSIVIILILLLGGAYVWQSRVSEKNAELSPGDEEELNSLQEDLDGADTSIEANVINSVE